MEHAQVVGPNENGMYKITPDEGYKIMNVITLKVYSEVVTDQVDRYIAVMA